MHAAPLETALHARLRHRRLLDHPFYRRWSAGGVSLAELRDYAAQYRHFEAMLPAHLEHVASSAAEVRLREQALRNLDDEAGSEPTHLQLFERFAGALDAPLDASPSPAMADLLATYRAAAAAGAVQGFAALLAYEMQAPEVSASKAEGLRTHGILDGDALGFWDVHATLDTEHAAWTLDALAASGADPQQVVDSAGAAADTWWNFLDEREALRVEA
jgi:pyrroloquinoline quinone (PQQ) biosynthesis protein C